MCSAAGGNDSISFFAATFVPLLPYLFWQLMYYLKVQIINTPAKNQDRMTSFKFLMADKKTLVYKLSNLAGPRYALFGFILVQLLYTLLTMLPIKLLYQNFWAHTVFLFGICFVSCWNGASFYIDVFSIKYQQSLLESEKRWKELSKQMEKDKSN